MGKFIDLIGKKFGRLTVIKKAYGNKYGVTYWLCKCDCGNFIETRATNLTNNLSQSCGCLNKIYKPEHKRLRQIFCNIKQRCYYPKSNRYKNYGARGIKICDEWLENPLKFCEWAMDNGYKDNLTIDRIDVNGDYSPQNCRWVDMKTQQNNRTNNHYLTYNNETHTLSEWSKIYKIPYGTLKSRIKYGWSVEKALKGA